MATGDTFLAASAKTGSTSSLGLATPLGLRAAATMGSTPSDDDDDDDDDGGGRGDPEGESPPVSFCSASLLGDTGAGWGRSSPRPEGRLEAAATISLAVILRSAFLGEVRPASSTSSALESLRGVDREVGTPARCRGAGFGGDTGSGL